MIDAFGHSSTNAALFADFGFEAMFFTRMDDKGRDKRILEHEMTFLWRPMSQHFGNEK